ncbi:ABC transporter substrate-binding protein [Kineosporia sp. R_H_3]|uniref:ABC transporter substrate-binding protein n=1 Tax=Kineosporia sp. R_H_3 TaxID=1961848 RepID=UPI0018EA1E1A|nr:ABC transporter substrate-binding protein [Kineosporia sp. R_H_3]
MQTSASPTRRSLLRTGAAAVSAAALLSLAACGGGSAASTGAAPAATAPSTDKTVAVNIGYFPNLTHAPGLVADAEGFFTKRIGDGKVKTQSFNAGPDVVQALFGGSLDIAYIGPNPTINAYAQSGGAAVRVISGATSGGASLVVKPEITTAALLKGKTLATPQLGNTQDVALRYWLKEQGLTTTVDGGGDVSIKPQKNSAALQAFASGQIDGAWVPEPFATQFVAAGGKVLVDEKTLWPGGKFVTTNVVVRTEFLQKNPDTVRAFLEANLDAVDFIAADPAKAQADVATKISAITGQEVKPATLADAWGNLTFSADPLQATLKESARHAQAVGLLEKAPSDDFAKLWDLAQLNAALKARGQAEVAAL